MYKLIPNQDRSALGFKKEVLCYFNFLIKEYAFRLITEEETQVSFESDKVLINVYHELLSYELIFEIGIKPSALGLIESKYTLSEIVELGNGQSDTKNVFFQASTASGVKKCISKMADLVNQYAQGALVGDKLVYEKLKLLQKHKSDKLINEMKLSRIRSKAEKLWKDKSYEQYINLYEGSQIELSIIELKKLEYAKKHIKESTI